jgi:splicing factor 1
MADLTAPAPAAADALPPPQPYEHNGAAPADAAAAAPPPAAPAADGSAAAVAAEEASRKRRSRWAPAAPAPPAAGEAAAPGAGDGSAADLDENGQPRKRSRWSKAPAAAGPAAAADPAASVLSLLTPEQIEAFKVQLRVDELTRMLQNPAEAMRADDLAREASGRRSRTPSPEPLYDSNGQRTNTRPIRFAVKLEKERQTLVETLQRLNPGYKPPVGFRKIRYERRLLIPIKEYPDYNFIGQSSQ